MNDEVEVIPRECPGLFEIEFQHLLEGAVGGVA